MPLLRPRRRTEEWTLGRARGVCYVTWRRAAQLALNATQQATIPSAAHRRAAGECVKPELG